MHLKYFQKGVQLGGQRCEVVQASRFGRVDELQITFANSAGAPLPGTPNAVLLEAQRAWGRELPENLATQIATDAETSYEQAHPGHNATLAGYASDFTEKDFDDTEDPVETWEQEFGDGAGGDGGS